MTSTQTKRARGNKDRRVARIWKAIDAILWSDWDPIGVNDAPEARDEYSSYIGGAFHFLEDCASEEQIGGHLHRIETERMGLSGNLDHCRQVAKKLLEIDMSRHADE